MDIFGIGVSELLVILVIAMIVVGPERMVELAGQAGRMFRKFRDSTQDVSKEFREAFTLEIQGGEQAAEQTAGQQAVTPTEPAPGTLVTTPKVIAPPITAASTAPAAAAQAAAPRVETKPVLQPKPKPEPKPAPPAPAPVEITSDVSELLGGAFGLSEPEEETEPAPESALPEAPEASAEPVPVTEEASAEPAALDAEDAALDAEDAAPDAEPAPEAEPALEAEAEPEPAAAPPAPPTVVPEEDEDDGGLNAPIPTFDLGLDLEAATPEGDGAKGKG